MNKRRVKKILFGLLITIFLAFIIFCFAIRIYARNNYVDVMSSGGYWRAVIAPSKGHDCDGYLIFQGNRSKLSNEKIEILGVDNSKDRNSNEVIQDERYYLFLGSDQRDSETCYEQPEIVMDIKWEQNGETKVSSIKIHYYGWNHLTLIEDIEWFLWNRGYILNLRSIFNV